MSKTVTLDAVWKDLTQGLDQVFRSLNEGMTAAKYMEMYTAVYNYCTPSKQATSSADQNGARFEGAPLYQRLQQYLRKHMQSLLKEADKRMDDSLLNFYKKQWDRYAASTKMVSGIFNYLNRHWVQKEADDRKNEVYKVFQLSMVIWRQEFFSPLSTRLTNALLTLIEKERNGEQIDTSLVTGCIGSYVRLGYGKNSPESPTLEVYQNEFEKAFLERTEEFYAAESVDFIAKNSVSDYLKKVEARLEEEKRRVRSYLHPSTEAELMAKCDRVLIDMHRDVMWAEFRTFLEHDKTDDLARICTILSRIPRGLNPLNMILQNHIQMVGLEAVRAAAATAIDDPRQYVEVILEVHQKYNTYVKDTFKGDVEFVAALDTACHNFINDNEVTALAKTTSKSPELVAKYCDLLLKKSPKNPDEQAILEILDNIMLVFKYIEDKDVFQTFYSKMLAKRLIHGTSASEYLEGQMIAMLKENCGYEYTSKLARMFNDMALSRDLMNDFNKSAGKSDLGGVEFTTLVLATGSWPLQPPSTNFELPAELVKCQQAFTKFYKNQNKRKLNWLLQLSKGEIKASFMTTSRTGYIFQCSTYQMGVLMLFNDNTTLTLADIQEATQLNDSALRATMMTLLKTRVLNMSAAARSSTGGPPTLTKETKFQLNRQFRNKRARVLINIPFREAREKETKETHETVQEDRNLLIQSAVVRIMKARKVLKHQALISEVISQLQSRFKPKIPTIKKCIDILIEKEYLERVDGEKDTYSYLA